MAEGPHLELRALKRKNGLKIAGVFKFSKPASCSMLPPSRHGLAGASLNLLKSTMNWGPSVEMPETITHSNHHAFIGPKLAVFCANILFRAV